MRTKTEDTPQSAGNALIRCTVLLACFIAIAWLHWFKARRMAEEIAESVDRKVTLQIAETWLKTLTNNNAR